MFENLFPKYKLDKLREVWIIRKRRLLFFYKHLTHVKLVSHDNWERAYVRSYEILAWDSEEAARDELDCLNFGYSPIISREYYNGKLVKEIRKQT